MNSPGKQSRLCRLGLLLVFAGLGIPRPGPAAGVTLITHGHLANATEWVIPMAAAIPTHPTFPGTNWASYKVTMAYAGGGGFSVTPSRLGGTAPTNTDTGEILVALDWSDIANDFLSSSTFDLAAALVPKLTQTNFIPELGGRALAELPLHLVGHSRGGSLVCELARFLGVRGIWVDHVTTLDPHPVNNDGFSDPTLPFITDAPARTYENVLFADNYYETSNFYPYGEPVAGAYIRFFASLNGGYSSAHSDVHLWYHGTIDLATPASDTQASINTAERQAWWTASEAQGAVAGYHYSRLGRGNRLSTDPPAGPGTAAIRDGYNQKWDLGAGLAANRTALASNSGNWASLIQLSLTGTNLVAPGTSTEAGFAYQWARPAGSNALVSFYLDDDLNPFNGHHPLLAEGLVPGTGSNQVRQGTLSLTALASNAPPGIHPLFAKITAGGRTRYLHASGSLTVVSSFQPPRLDLVRASAAQVRVDVSGVAGQRVVLQRSGDLRTWTPLATNWLATNRWVYLDNAPSPTRRFYRAVVK